MRGGRRRRRGLRAGAVALVAIALAAACGAPSAENTPVPTFATPTEQRDASGAPTPADGEIPDDCVRVLDPAVIEAVLGLPLGSVGVRTIIGIPQPSVGRTERVSCSYVGTPAGPANGRTLLDVNASAYTDPDAARNQWRVNADAEDGDRRELPIGSASAVLIDRADESVLMVVHGTSNLSLVLPDRPLPGGRPRGDALVDIALRALPAVAQSGAAPPPPTSRTQRPGSA
ncbi:hypothetical protein [Pseudonocardia nigra]|uniref:hypothetical protein n=1 Tax=Pseudonocardia nigra TaxID=1921578 RepID=UPI001C601FCF|nr:hypothetical protein [Pseudonocardia nigra]